MKRYVVAALVVLVAGSVQAQTKKEPTSHSNASQQARWQDAYKQFKGVVDGPHATKAKCTTCHHFAQDVYSASTAQWVLDLKSDDHFQPHVGFELQVAQNAGDMALLYGLDTQNFQPKAGVFLAKPSQATRSMLSLPKDSGLIVRGVCEPLSKNLAGLREHDIVLMVNDKPATNPTELDTVLAGNQQLALVVMRDGEQKKLERKSANAEDGKRYLIGVTLGEVDPAVRAHMKLSDEVRVFVADVAKDGAAEQAGIKPHDIFVRINDKKTTSRESVQAIVQESKGKPLHIDLRRGAKQINVKLTPKLTGKVTAIAIPNAEHRIELVEVKDSPATDATGAPPSPSEANDLQKRLDDMDKKLDELMTIIKTLKSDG